MNNKELKKKAALISLFVGFGMFFAKIIAYLITDSTAIFSDAAESVVHVLATTMTLYSIILSSKPPDKSHLYGHGNIEYFSAGIEGLLIVLAAGTIIYASVERIIIGTQPEQLDIGILIISAAGIINLILGLYLIRQGKKTNSVALIADGKHVLTDSYTSLGVIIGLILVLITDFTLLDPIFAIFVAINIIFTGFKLVRESIGGLMNETDNVVLNKIIERLSKNRKDYWIDIHHLRFWISAERIFIDFHLLLPYYFSIKRSHLEEEFIRSMILEELPGTDVRIHLDYCAPSYCKYCDYGQCDVREEPKSKSFEWNVEKLIGEPIDIRSSIY